MPQMQTHIVKLLVAIVDRGKGAALVDVYRDQRLPLEYLCMGMGTANSRLLDYFGLSETQKDVVLTFAPAHRVAGVLRAVNERFDLSNPGRGIVFSCPLSGVSSQVPQLLDAGTVPVEEESYVEENPCAHDLVVVVVNRGFVDPAMDAAREAGARGGTVVHGRSMADEGAGAHSGFSLEPEKDIVLVVVAHEQKLAVMRAVNKAAGLATPSRGILFSLPVEDLMGLQDPPAQDSAPDDAARPAPAEDQA